MRVAIPHVFPPPEVPMKKNSNADKTITLQIRRVRAQVRTSVTTGAAAIRKTQTQGQCGYSLTTG